MSSLPSQKAWQGLLRPVVGFAPVAWLGPIVEATTQTSQVNLNLEILKSMGLLIFTKINKSNRDLKVR